MQIIKTKIYSWLLVQSLDLTREFLIYFHYDFYAMYVLEQCKDRPGGLHALKIIPVSSFPIATLIMLRLTRSQSQSLQERYVKERRTSNKRSLLK